MKKVISISLVATLLVCAFALSNLFAASKAPATLVLKAPDGMKTKKTPVNFPHGRHGDMLKDCTICHHTDSGSGDRTSCSAAGCHDKESKKEQMAYYKAFHGKNERSCVGCHKAKKKGPKSCKQCHPKK